jgi:hypothetical protein
MSDVMLADLADGFKRVDGHREKAQIALRIATDHYNELKTHVQDVLRDADLWDEFDTEKLAKHGIVKPPTTYSCEYVVKYTGTVTVKADSEEAARNKADEIVTSGISCQLSDIEDDEITDQTHNDFDVEINGCEEQ